MSSFVLCIDPMHMFALNYVVPLSISRASRTRRRSKAGSRMKPTVPRSVGGERGDEPMRTKKRRGMSTKTSRAKYAEERGERTLDTRWRPFGLLWRKGVM